MDKKAKVGIPLALIAAIAGGSYAFTFDFSQTTETNISGDTNINIETEGEDYCELARLACEEDLIPEQYEAVCPIINTVCG